MRDSLVSAFELRQMGDYGSPGSISKEKAQTLIEQAKEFIEIVEKSLIELIAIGLYRDGKITLRQAADVIIHLAKLNELILIKELYGCAHIPEYVESEIVRYQYDETGMIEEAIRQGILKVHGTSESRAKELAKRYGIHIGEGHVKDLAEKLDASIFLSNEKKVRIAAKM